jgi:rRNA maturation RNase YbeY
MSADLRLRNHQRTRRLDLRRLRRVIRVLLAELLQQADYDLAVQFVNASAMARLNQKHLGHEGSTDVITLDYAGTAEEPICGELLVCVDEALIQARRFRAPWTEEVARYVVHGILHLRGYDDRTTPARRRMKLAEARLLRELARRFRLSTLARKGKLAA